MISHFDILIDASGSMGLMQGTNHEGKYLLSDGSTRTDLVKKILVNTIIPKLSFIDSISISIFRDEYYLNKKGERIIVNNKYKNYPNLKNVYNGSFELNEINATIKDILNPESNGTPLSWALKYTMNTSKNDVLNIIILSDGDASDDENFDFAVLKRLREINKPCKIYFIGISQNEVAQKKSKNLANQTNGFYVNLEIINYDEVIFNNMLFEFNTTITSNALKENLNIASAGVNEILSKKNEEKSEAKALEILKDNVIVDEVFNSKENETNELKSQVEENTKSLKLITSQLDSIIKQINYFGNEKTKIEEEFETKEDEERNKIIGYQCEKHLNSVFTKNNWEKVNWLNEVAEQSKPYDFEVTVGGISYYIECKGSTSNSKEFFVTKNEWQFYLNNRKNYRLYYVSEINTTNPEIIRIEDLLVDMSEGKLIPCSNVNRKVKAERILFQIID